MSFSSDNNTFHDTVVPDKFGKKAKPQGISHLESADHVLLVATFATAVVGAALIGVGFFLRFGRGMGNFVTYARQDNDFLELKRLDMIFGLFTAAAVVLILTFLLAAVATYKQHTFLLKLYCGCIALMVIVQLVTGLLAFTYSDQVNQLASDDVLYESLNKTIVAYQKSKPTIPTDTETQFWTHSQKTFSCCGVQSQKDWVSMTEDDIHKYGCYTPNYAKGCDKVIRNRVSSDAQFFGAAAMGTVVVEIIASFLAGYRAYNLTYGDP